MAWATKSSLFRRAGSILIAVSAAAGGTWLYSNKHNLLPQAVTQQRQGEEHGPNSQLLGSVLASWTTNFKPTVEWDKNWDRRDPASLVKPSKGKNEDEKDNDYENELKKATPTASRHLFLIRHGQYNLDGNTDIDRYLTPLGREQADFTGRRLSELAYPFERMVNSTMTRAVETADIIAKHLPTVPRESCSMLREGAPIPPEPPIGNWRPEAEFFQDGARIEAAFRKYFHRACPKQEKDSYEVIVCHANVIRYFVCRALQLPPEAWLRMSLQHASITWFTIRPSGRVAVRAVGDSGHIPVDRLSVT